jgi:hypothetical protein
VFPPSPDSLPRRIHAGLGILLILSAATDLPLGPQASPAPFGRITLLILSGDRALHREQKSQVVARRNLTLEEFIKEFTNFHNIRAKWKNIVKLVCPFLIDWFCSNSCIVSALRTVQRSKMGMRSENV